MKLDDETYARAALTYMASPSDTALGALIRTHGTAQGALETVRTGKVPVGMDTAAALHVARSLTLWQSKLDQVPQRDVLAGMLTVRGIRLTYPGGPEWAQQLADLGDTQPYALWLRGAADLQFSCRRSVAIAGSRAATAYGSYIASEFASSLAGNGWAVISGAAFGIDAAAHRGALAANGVTVAVLACGVDVPYPAAHAELLNAIATEGLIVSELPPGTIAGRLQFLERNRITAAMASGTVVVEATDRGGAMNCARHARDLKRPLMAVPGPITSELSAGCHRIIREWGGMLVTGANDVIRLLDSGHGP